MTLPKGCNCAQGVKTGRYQWVRPTLEVPIWFYESRKKELLSILGTTPVPKPGWNTTEIRCDKDSFPASNENFHEMASAEELMGRNILFSYAKEEAWGTTEL